jgi:N-methylhydantoinase A
MTTVTGIDVGGTFTDFIGYDSESGRLVIDKRPTTLQDQSIAVVEAVQSFGVPFDRIDQIVHGTTTATNALIERKGARSALITTKGFRDIIECGRRERQSVYGLSGSFEPLIPRNHRFEVSGRLDRLGNEIEPMDPSELARLVDTLTANGYDSVAICLMHAYADNAHEVHIDAALQEIREDLYVARSSTVVAEIGEFERMSTAVISAYIGPTMRRYLGRLNEGLRGLGFGRDFMVVQSNAGAVAHGLATRQPATTIMSGPAGGVNGAVAVAAADGRHNVISLDMGGTSADIAVAVNGRVPISTENSIGFRLPLQVPMLDIATIGAGGGSIAWLDDAGILRVGPHSAGSHPGPASYGHGGTLPTVTDAHLVLGHLLVTSMAANGLPELDVEAARAALGSIATPLGIDVETAAEAVLEVVNENMAGQVRLATIDQGLDARPFALVAFGGAGPLHACAVVRKLGMAGAVIPVFPGITSAMGCTLCDVRHEFGQTVRTRLDELDLGELRRIFDAQRDAGTLMLQEEGMQQENIRQDLGLTMMYEGQRHPISVELNMADAGSVQAMREAFDVKYEMVYGRLLNQPILVVNARSSVSAPLEHLNLAACGVALREGGGGERGQVDAYFGGKPYNMNIIPRHLLEPDDRVVGPALITQRDSTTTIEPGFVAVVMPSGNLWIERGSQ